MVQANILKFKDADGAPLVEKIRDTAGQKGTGKWTGIESLDLGCVPPPALSLHRTWVVQATDACYLCPLWTRT